MEYNVNILKKILCCVLTITFVTQGFTLIDFPVFKPKLAQAGNRPLSKSLSNTSANITISYYHTDHLRSSSVLTDTNGSIVQRVQYYPYGDALSELIVNS